MEHVKDVLPTMCGNVVSLLKKEEEDRDCDIYVGYTDGLQSIIQKNVYVAANSELFEKNMRHGITNIGNCISPMILYYWKQEHHFNTWFNKDVLSKLNRFHCDQIIESSINELFV
jgi:hypothetical protein